MPKTIKPTMKKFQPSWIIIDQPFSVEYGFIGGAVVKVASHLLFSKGTLLQLTKQQRKQLIKDLNQL